MRSNSEDRGEGFMETGKSISLNQWTKGQAMTTPFFLGLEIVTDQRLPIYALNRWRPFFKTLLNRDLNKSIK